MPQNNPALPCATQQPVPRRLHASDAVVIIVIVLTAAALNLRGLPVTDVLQLLAGASLLSIVLVWLSTAAPVRALRLALRAAATGTTA
ncbi:hypothetical protein [Streptomyces sp. NPDC047718]|uniref:hypothetical protein n=1 Tax=Streptomyces sp. NPDC047718 TaxID=3155479 RepID=UPI0033EA6197